MTVLHERKGKDKKEKERNRKRAKKTERENGHMFIVLLGKWPFYTRQQKREVNPAGDNTTRVRGI